MVRTLSRSGRTGYRGEVLPGGGHVRDPASGAIARQPPERVRVTRPDGTELDPGPSLKVRNHSPTGFAWGYEGSGPAQLALALLLDFTGDRGFAAAHYQTFKRDVVARWPWPPDPGGTAWTLPVRDLDAWLEDAAARRGSTRRP